MLREIFTRVFFIANLAHDHHLRAITLDVFVQLSTRHMLVLITIANVAAKLRAVELSMNLQLSQGLPNDLSFTIWSRASMWELAEINTVLEYFVHWLQEVTSCLAIWAADVKVGRDTRLLASSSHAR